MGLSAKSINYSFFLHRKKNNNHEFIVYPDWLAIDEIVLTGG